MNVFITFDYELFFGSDSGSIEKCMILPTNRLIEMSIKQNVNFTYFVDAGYLVKLKLFSKQFPVLEKDYSLVSKQLKSLVENGDSIQLHIHPHWERSFYDGDKWVFEIDGNYALSDFESEEVSIIIKKYKEALESIISKPVTSYRAGGLAVQPFSNIKQDLLKSNIVIDSSVQNFGYKSTNSYAFDFREAPNKGSYRFESDVCKEEGEGSFLEMPIAGWKYSRFFYLKLYLLGFLFPSKHKFIGDGNYVPTPNEKKIKLLYSRFDNISCDGFYCSKLIKAFKSFKKTGRTDTVVLGHPKSQTLFSLKQLDKTIFYTKEKYNYSTFDDLK